jgi:hypothetical protein
LPKNKRNHRHEATTRILDGSAANAEPEKKQSFFYSERAACAAGPKSPARGTDFEAHAFRLLQIDNDLKQVASLGVAVGAEHPHQAFRRALGNAAQFGKTNRGVDEIAKNDLPGFHVAGKKVFDSFAEERLAKARIVLHARPDSCP